MIKELALFDLDGTLWNIKNDDIWIIDKDKPYKPILTISDIEFSLIKNGNYINDHMPLNYNGEKFYISKELFDLIKLKSKSDNIERFGISFMPKIKKELLNKKEFDVLLNNIEHLRYNKFVDIGLLTARSNQKNHSDLLNKLRLELNKIGIEIKKIFFVGNRGYTSSPDKKLQVILEHLIGLKISGNKFIYLKQDWYKRVSFYDDDIKNINYANNIQDYFNELLLNTDDELFNIIMDRINNYNLVLETNLVSNNQLNKFKKNKIILTKPSRFPIQESVVNEGLFRKSRKEKDDNFLLTLDYYLRKLKIEKSKIEISGSYKYYKYHDIFLDLIIDYLLNYKKDNNYETIKKIEFIYIDFFNEIANSMASRSKIRILNNSVKLNTVNNLFKHISKFYNIELEDILKNIDQIVVYQIDGYWNLIFNKKLQKLKKEERDKHADIDPYIAPVPPGRSVAVRNFGEEDWQDN